MNLKKQIKKVDKKIQELNGYLQYFNSSLAPRGDGARLEASKEFHQFMKELHKNLYGLEEAQLNKFDWSIETIKIME